MRPISQSICVRSQICKGSSPCKHRQKKSARKCFEILAPGHTRHRVNGLKNSLFRTHNDTNEAPRIRISTHIVDVKGASCVGDYANISLSCWYYWLLFSSSFAHKSAFCKSASQPSKMCVNSLTLLESSVNDPIHTNENIYILRLPAVSWSASCVNGTSRPQTTPLSLKRRTDWKVTHYSGPAWFESFFQLISSILQFFPKKCRL